MRSLRSLLILLTTLSVACTTEPGRQRIQVKSVKVVAGQTMATARIKQEVNLSGEAVRALQNGVPLRLTLTAELRTLSSLANIATEERIFEIRYLPLSELYQLEDLRTQETRSYPRLRHVMTELSTVRVRLETGPLPSGQYEIRARSRLDRSTLPAPMQLPTLILTQWHHDSDWTQWPFTIDA